MILRFTSVTEVNWIGINGPWHRLRCLVMLEAEITLLSTTSRLITIRVAAAHLLHLPLSTITLQRAHCDLKVTSS